MEIMERNEEKNRASANQKKWKETEPSWNGSIFK
jgi:hypothetical protein